MVDSTADEVRRNLTNSKRDFSYPVNWSGCQAAGIAPQRCRRPRRASQLILNKSAEYAPTPDVVAVNPAQRPVRGGK